MLAAAALDADELRVQKVCKTVIAAGDLDSFRLTSAAFPLTLNPSPRKGFSRFEPLN